MRFRQMHGIAEVVAEEFGVTTDDMRGYSRKRIVVYPRWAAQRLIREITGATYSELGLYFRRDHSTVIDGVRRAGELEAEVSSFADTMVRLRERLSAVRRPIFIRRGSVMRPVFRSCRSGLRWP